MIAEEDIVDTNASLNSDLSLTSNDEDTDDEPDSASDDDLSVTSAITQHQGATPPETTENQGAPAHNKKMTTPQMIHQCNLVNNLHLDQHHDLEELTQDKV